MTTPAPALELEGLTRRFGDVMALDGVSFTVPSGEVFGLLGPNGAGKTTAMRIVMGLLAPDAGRLRWKGEPVGPSERMRFGYLPEERGLYPSMSVRDHLVYIGRLHGMSRHDALASTDVWLERMGLADRADAKIVTLSLGNQQRVQLAAALVHAPQVLVLDEPFSGLDPIGIDLMGKVLDEIASSGAVVVFSSHQLDLVEDRCRSVVILNRGRVVAAGAVGDLTRPRRPRLIVEVDAPDVFGDFALTGVTVAGTDAGGRRAHLVLEEHVDPQAVLTQALRYGPVTHFSFERLRLSEVFREAVS